MPGVTSVDDDNGHGTHVASTIVGTGAASDGRYKGVAPGAKLLIGKVIDGSGTGDWSWTLAGMDWAAHHARIVSMSLGGDPTDGTDPITEAVNQLSAETGSLFVIAAGNSGTPQTIGTPGTAEAALTVAGTTKTDQETWFSSEGPRLDGLLKPDIAAPGQDIVAARAAHGYEGDPVSQYYTSMSGTSMATPHVAGAAAILAQPHPDWKAPQFKAALMGTAKDVGLNVYQQGAGRLDVARADRQKVLATTANLDFGLVPTSKQDGAITKQVGYSNASDTPVTLTLTPSLRTLDGTALTGVLAGDKTVTVPAHGTASANVTLTADGLGRGEYSGQLVATDQAGDIQVDTPVGLVRWPPLATLTIRTIDRDGNLAYPLLLDVIEIAQGGKGRITNAYSPETGVIATRVPEGTYSISAQSAWVDDKSLQHVAYLTNPQFTFQGDATITLDARKTRPITFTTPKESRPVPGDGVDSELQRTTESGDRYAIAQPIADDNTDAWYQLDATPTGQVTKGKFSFNTHWTRGPGQVGLSVLGRESRTLHPALLFGYSEGQGGHPDYVPITGSRDLPLVDVGQGNPEDLAGKDLRGKLALLRTPDCNLWIEQVGAIRDAGAAAIVAYPPAGLGCSIPMELAQIQLTGPLKPVGIPHVAVSAAEGADLHQRLAQGPLTLRLSGNPKMPYIYTLAPYEEGRIPDSLNYHLTDGKLATIDSAPHGSTPYVYMDWTAQRDSMQPLGVFDTVNTEVLTPNFREYIGPLSEHVLHRRFMLPYVDDHLLASMSRFDVFDRPVRQTQAWYTRAATPGADAFSPAVEKVLGSPGPNTVPLGIYGYCQFCRTGDRIDIPGLFRMYSDGGAIAMDPTAGAEENPDNWDWHLYKGDTEIQREDDYLCCFPMAPEKATYRLTGHSPAPTSPGRSPRSGPPPTPCTAATWTGCATRAPPGTSTRNRSCWSTTIPERPWQPTTAFPPEVNTPSPSTSTTLRRR